MTYDAVIVGAGPNGLAAGITLARAGKSVLILEAKDTIGGGTRSAELTLPGFVHDICSALHPLGVTSPFFRNLPLDRYGLEWVFPPACLAHPLDDGTAVLVEGSVQETAATLGPDKAAYRRMMSPLVAGWSGLLADILGPLRLPRHPWQMARFGVMALLPAATLARMAFCGERARAVFAGMAAHAMMPLTRPATAAFGLVLNLVAHGVGWPMPRGGAQHIADALAAYFSRWGGRLSQDVGCAPAQTSPIHEPFFLTPLLLAALLLIFPDLQMVPRLFIEISKGTPINSVRRFSCAQIDPLTGSQVVGRATASVVWPVN